MSETKLQRPTIALCCIMKDEMHHIKDLLKSVHGCFDEIHLTDTGSTDGSDEFAQSYEAKTLAGCPIHLKRFTWIDDFSAARNFSMQGVQTDFVMWLDLDDELSSKENFIRWRDNVMVLADYWLAPYYYAFDNEGRPLCTFIRERVVKTSKKFSWKYFIHEGMIADESVQAQFTNHWHVNHRRSAKDYEIDYQRNVSMLEKRAKTENLPTRLKFYYGKELFDKGRWAEAYVWLDQVVDSRELEHHDRILTYEYLVRSCLQRYLNEEAHKPDKKYDLVAKALSLAMQATVLAPNRAEFWCLAGDCFVQMGKEQESLPCYAAAANCSLPGANDPSFLFASAPAYTFVPRNMIANIKFRKGDLDGALFEAQECFKKYQDPSTQELLGQLMAMKGRIETHKTTKKMRTDEIVFSCLPGAHPYSFDEEIYKSKGIGGSETALVEVAMHLKKLTGKRIIVFNTREGAKVEASGVEYRPAQEMHEYFTHYEPATHIAWRHNVKLTEAPTYLWCHDLYTPGGEIHKNYEKILCLSQFHKEYVQVLQNIPESKIVITRNGVNKERFEGLNVTKDEKKIVFPSSPDRGLDRAIKIVELARQNEPGLELHAFYGFDNMKRSPGPMRDLALKIEEMAASRPWVKLRGNVDQTTLAREMAESVVWLYPANFIETYCITAIEAAYAKCYPLVRALGALRDTLKPFADKGQATLFFKDASTEAELEAWAVQLLYVLQTKAWKRIDTTGYDYSWEGVAKHFIEIMGIQADEVLVTNSTTVDDDTMPLDVLDF